jgi:DNA polymerase
MAIITVDYESFYDPQYSLSKMSEVAYILDPRFQTIMASIKVDQQPTEVFIGHRAVAEKLHSFDWSRCAWLSHNTRFDGAIAAWHFGIEPALWLDTLSMARATTHWVMGRSSLAKLSEYLGLPPKGDEVVRAIGKQLENFAPDELAAYADYCKRDTDNCRLIFDRLKPLIPNDELRLIDLTLRMFITPQIKLNPYALAEHLAEVQATLAQIMATVAHIDPSTFSSNQKFAALLESYGVDVPRKISPTTGDETYALARNDRAFKELCVDQDQPLEVQALLAARLNTKSTLEETCTRKLLDLSLMEWPNSSSSWGPVPIKHYGARTGRMSGDGGTNWLNFKRGSKIREGIEAPPGYRIVHRDASQIEARMVAFLARCMHLLEAFAQGRDVYSEFASGVYRRHVTKADVQGRFVGKTAILGLGYSCGWEKFRHMLFIGNGGVSFSIDEEESKRIVYHYRRTYPEIPALWQDGGLLLQRVIHLSRMTSRELRAVDTEAFVEGIVTPGFDSLWLPNKMCIAYPNIRYERAPATNQYQMVYDDPYGGWRKIYGGKVTENISQALSRIIVTDSAVRIFDLTGRHPFLSTYDSLDYCVPESEACWWNEELGRQFAVRPSWGLDLPLASEGGYGKTLAAAEAGENC